MDIDAVRSCVILHVSDFHFSRSGGKSELDRDLVLTPLLQKISEVSLDTEWHPDLVVCTGDVTQSGEDEEYQAARLFFIRLLSQLQLERSRLFIVPGNHDVNKQDAEIAHKSIAKLLSVSTYSKFRETLFEMTNPSDFLRQSNILFDNHEIYKALLSKFAKYRSFVESLGRGFDDDGYCFADVITVNSGLQIGLVGLNTAWLFADAGKHIEQSQQLIGRRPLERAFHKLEQMENAGHRPDIVVTLRHHPTSWLYEGERKSVWSDLCQKTQIVLEGHEDNPDQQFSFSSSGTPKVLVLQEGPAYQGSHNPNRVEFIRCEVAASKKFIEVLSIKYLPSPRLWIQDLETFAEQRQPNGHGIFVISQSDEPDESRELSDLLTARLTWIYNRLAPGTSLPLRDILTSLYVPNAWAKDAFSPAESSDAFDVLKEKLGSDREAGRIMLIGHSGCGKTLLLLKILDHLTKSYLRGDRKRLPLCADLSTFEHFLGNRNTSSSLLANFLASQFSDVGHLNPSTVQSFSDKKNLVILLDGLDALADNPAVFAARWRMLREVAGQVNMVVCKDWFWERYVLGTSLNEEYPTKMHLLPFSSIQAEKLVANFCSLYGVSYDKFMSELRSPQDDKTMPSNPLWIVMALEDHLNREKGRASESKLQKQDLSTYRSPWAPVSLYDRTMERLAIRDTLLPASKLELSERLFLFEELAWFLYIRGRSGVSVQKADLDNFAHAILKDNETLQIRGLKASDIQDALFRSGMLLSSREAGSLVFHHPSFFPFLVAKKIFHASLSEKDAAKIWTRFYSKNEVSYFLRDMVANDPLVADILQQMICTHEGSLKEDIMARNEAYYYLGWTKIPRALDFLEVRLDKEMHPWPRRSILVTLTFNRSKHFMNKYIDEMEKSEQEMLVNLFYHFWYYGDMEFTDIPDQLYQQQLPASCPRTLRALTGHITESRYTPIKALSLFTLKSIISKGGIDILGDLAQSILRILGDLPRPSDSADDLTIKLLAELRDQLSEQMSGNK